MSKKTPKRKPSLRQQQKAQQLAATLRANGFYSSKKKPKTKGQADYIVRRFKKVARLLDTKEFHKIAAPTDAIKQAKKAGSATSTKFVFVQKYGEGSADLKKTGRGKNRRYAIVKKRADREGETVIPLGPESHPDLILKRLEREAKALKKTFKSKHDRLAFEIRDANGNHSRNTFTSVAQLRKALREYSRRSADLWRGFLNSIVIVKTTPQDHAKLRAEIRKAKKRHRDARERKTGK